MFSDFTIYEVSSFEAREQVFEEMSSFRLTSSAEEFNFMLRAAVFAVQYRLLLAVACVRVVLCPNGSSVQALRPS
jgi:hypothetical protein